MEGTNIYCDYWLHTISPDKTMSQTFNKISSWHLGCQLPNTTLTFIQTLVPYAHICNKAKHRQLKNNRDKPYRIHSHMSCRNSITAWFQHFKALLCRVPQFNVQPFLCTHAHMAIIFIPATRKSGKTFQ